MSIKASKIPALASDEAAERFVAEADLSQYDLSGFRPSAFEFEPKAIRSQATTVVSTRVDELSKEATARRDLIEKRVAALQADAQKFVTTNVETATDTYETLAKRGETVVKKLRGEAAQTVAPEGKVVRIPKAVMALLGFLPKET